MVPEEERKCVVVGMTGCVVERWYPRTEAGVLGWQGSTYSLWPVKGLGAGEPQRQLLGKKMWASEALAQERQGALWLGDECRQLPTGPSGPLDS